MPDEPPRPDSPPDPDGTRGSDPGSDPGSRPGHPDAEWPRDGGVAEVPPAGDLPPEEEERQGPLRTFLGLFLVPLLVVGVCVAIFAGFGWIAYEGNDVGDYVSDLGSGWRPRRAQAAYELSKILLADPDALAGEPGVQAEIRRQFAAADDAAIQRYLALVLGRSGDPEAAATLLAALPEAGPETRVYILLALGTTGDRAALPALVEALGDDDPGARKTAAYALGELGDPAAAPHLEALLSDPAADVRWNAAIALARLGSDAGVPVLRRMLDRDLTAQVPGITPEQQEEAMVQAVTALAAVGGAESRALLERLAEEDPSLKVRQAALEGLKAGGGR